MMSETITKATNEGLDAYARIMLAARKRKGLRLSSAEVSALSRDDAISTAAENTICDKCLNARPVRWRCRHGTREERIVNAMDERY